MPSTGYLNIGCGFWAHNGGKREQGHELYWLMRVLPETGPSLLVMGPVV